MQATASLTSHGLRTDIERAEVCGIGMVGSVDVAGGEIALDLSVAVTDGPLEPTSLCLTENLIGALLGGSIVGIPVRVTGSLERPDVTYLSPADVKAELVNIPARALGVSRDAIRLFTPGRREPVRQ